MSVNDAYLLKQIDIDKYPLKYLKEYNNSLKFLLNNENIQETQEKCIFINFILLC